jgi:hypothetical protein
LFFFFPFFAFFHKLQSKCPAIVTSFDASSVTLPTSSTAEMSLLGLLSGAPATCAAAVVDAARESARGPCAALVRNLTQTATSTSTSLSSSASSLSAGFLEAATVSNMCRSPCLARLAEASAGLVNACVPGGSDALATALAPIKVLGTVLGVACKRNQNGEFCGSALAPTSARGIFDAIFGSSGTSRAVSRARTTAPALNGVGATAAAATTAATTERRGASRFGPRAASATPSAAPSVEAKPLPAGLTCDDFEPLIPEVNKLKARIGCCFGEIFTILLDPTILGETVSGLVGDILGGLQTCGVEFSQCTLRTAAAGAPVLTGVLPFLAPRTWTVPAARPSSAALEDALRDDLAAEFAVVVDRVAIAEVVFNATAVPGLPANFSAGASQSLVAATFTVVADDQGSAGLREIAQRDNVEWVCLLFRGGKNCCFFWFFFWFFCLFQLCQPHHLKFPSSKFAQRQPPSLRPLCFSTQTLPRAGPVTARWSSPRVIRTF